MNLNSKPALGIVGGVIGALLIGFGIEELIEAISKNDKNDFHKQDFDPQGYNRAGYNRQGFDPEGFDKEGFGSNGFDRTGLDQKGYDRSGFDSDGFDRCGRDTEGYDRAGFARDGFNRGGHDRQGYGRDRYNGLGIDRAGCCRQFYSSYIEQLQDRLSQASRQMQYRKYRYALYDARIIMEEALKLIVQHERGKAALGDRLLANLKICECKQLLDNEFIDKLHDARKICNANGHEFGSDDRISHNKVYFVIMQVRDLLNNTEKYIGTCLISGGV